MSRILVIQSLWIVVLFNAQLVRGENGDSDPLPHPKKFDPTKYLGKWYEAARLPAEGQPADSLATAEYSRPEDGDYVAVKNTAFRRDGSVVGALQGKARLVEGGAPGRLAVSFGGEIPEEPNYHVLFVDRRYRHAVVGAADRSSLWVLAREVPVRAGKLNRLVAIAKKAGFETGKLIIADWSRAAPLPHPKKFEPARYLGKWFEAARMPTPAQSKGSLATAEYSATKKPGEVRVRNTALSAQGEVLGTIDGKARQIGDGPPGRFAVTFGPTFPTKPNYCVLHVDKEYRHALVGTPDRKSLWILAREVPVGRRPLKRLKAIGARYGFDIDRLILGDWSGVKLESKRETTKLTADDLVGTWTFEKGVRDGRKVDDKRLPDWSVQITKETFTLKTSVTFVMSYELDARQDPAAIEFRIDEGPFGKGSTAPGILRIARGRLTVCYHPRGGDRPTEFEADAGSGHFAFVLVRKDAE